MDEARAGAERLKEHSVGARAPGRRDLRFLAENLDREFPVRRNSSTSTTRGGAFPPPRGGRHPRARRKRPRPRGRGLGRWYAHVESQAARRAPDRRAGRRDRIRSHTAGGSTWSRSVSWKPGERRRRHGVSGQRLSLDAPSGRGVESARRRARGACHGRRHRRSDRCANRIWRSRGWVPQRLGLSDPRDR